MNCVKAGFGLKQIDINFPVNLSGFAGNRIAQRTNDSLYVRVLVWEISHERYIWINYDLIAIDDLLLNKIYNAISLPKEKIFVSATHTHSGIGGCLKTDEGIFNGFEYLFCKKNIDIVESVFNNTLKAIQIAFDDIEYVSINANSGKMIDICSNRNDPNLCGDEAMLLLELIQDSGKKILIYNFACHPTILNQQNLDVSADFPGAINKKVMNDGYYYAMFINGSAGDISTRFTRKETGINELKRISELLYNQIKKIDLKRLDVTEFKVLNFEVSLRVKCKKNIEEAMNDVDVALCKIKKHGNTNKNIRIYESEYEGAVANYYFSKCFPDTIKNVLVNIQIWQLSSYFIICVPGELFSELSNLIKEKNIFFASYSNGYLGYFSDEKGYENNVYEALSSPFEKGQGEYMIECIKENLLQFK